MRLQLIDIAFVVMYLAMMVMIGRYYRKKARQNKESTCWAAKKLPWYMLSLSDAAGMFTVSGTMWKCSFDVKHGGYDEVCSRNWQEMDEIRRSAKDANERKSVNTHTHTHIHTHTCTCWKSFRTFTA